MIGAAAAVLAAIGWQLASAPPAPLPSATLKHRLGQAQARISAWEIEYEAARQDQRGVPAVSYIHRLIAAKAPDKFFAWTAHGTPWLDWSDDPYQQRLVVTTDRMIAGWPLDRLFNDQPLRPDAPLPGSAPGELLLAALGWWPLANRPPPILLDDVPTALSKVAQSSAYQARPQLEKVGDRWCNVLERPGLDRLWLDAYRGCALVARQYSPSGKDRVQRFEFADFQELLPGIWAPFTLRNIQYERMAGGRPGRVLHDNKLTFLRVRLNEAVTDARFCFEPPPGSIGRTGDGPLRQVVPGGQTYLDEVLNWIHRYQELAEAPKLHALWPRPLDILLGALLGGFAVVGLKWKGHILLRWVKGGS